MLNQVDVKKLGKIIKINSWKKSGFGIGCFFVTILRILNENVLILFDVYF